MNNSDNSFATRMDGKFYGVLQWSDLDKLWGKVRDNPEGWYASLTGETPPVVPMTAAALVSFVSEIDTLLHREHEENYCGVVYVDDTEKPSLLKIFDPHNMGTGCRVGGDPIPPLWVLSRIKPELIKNNVPLSNSRRRWWQTLFGKAA